ncbi:MAG TPA: phosphatase PAP2 family protein [Ktedonobacteraceae bacterium]|nr:phosphatase PAP2 family protein [Ktedonobacteraceae bacterium]
MHKITHPKGIQIPTATTTAGGEQRQEAQRRHRIEAVFWCLGVIVFILASFMVHAHPKPYAIDLATTEWVQGLHLPAWFDAVLRFPSILNNPLPSLIAVIAWFVFMLVMALIFKLQDRSPLTWLQAAIFFALTIGGSYGLQGIVELLVNRPRPNPHLYPIHLYTPLVPFPTYPSGHTDFDVVYYGFLLYLSFTKPVREWRYHWFLLPLQIFAMFAILSIGYSRILEGDHWLTDVLAGYLEGAISLFLFIFLYRWATNWLAQRRKKKLLLG